MSKISVNKAVTVGLLLVALLLIGVLYFSRFSKVEIESSTGTWRAVFIKYDYENHPFWDGTLVYDGSADVSDISTVLTYNGEVLKSDKDDNSLQPEEGYTLREQLGLGVKKSEKVFFPIIAFADEPKDVIVEIKWKENGEVFEEKLSKSFE